MIYHRLHKPRDFLESFFHDLFRIARSSKVLSIMIFRSPDLSRICINVLSPQRPLFSVGQTYAYLYFINLCFVDGTRKHDCLSELIAKLQFGRPHYSTSTYTKWQLRWAIRQGMFLDSTGSPEDDSCRATCCLFCTTDYRKKISVVRWHSLSVSRVGVGAEQGRWLYPLVWHIIRKSGE